jgi:hypothetical protein
MKFPTGHHPGSGYVYVICDICGQKVRRNDTVVVHDKWNTQNGMVVCNRDVDLVNPQTIPYKRKERLIDSTRGIRSQPSNTFADVPNDNRVPSAPRNLAATGDFSGSYVMLSWEGPLDPGTSSIVGYVVERIDGSGNATTFTISGNATFYVDTSASSSSQFQYRIAAVNTAGQGAYSANAFFPTYFDPFPDGTYIQLSQEERFILTSDGLYITF